MEKVQLNMRFDRKLVEALTKWAEEESQSHGIYFSRANLIQLLLKKAVAGRSK